MVADSVNEHDEMPRPGWSIDHPWSFRNRSSAALRREYMHRNIASINTGLVGGGAYGAGARLLCAVQRPVRSTNARFWATATVCRSVHCGRSIQPLAVSQVQGG